MLEHEERDKNEDDSRADWVAYGMMILSRRESGKTAVPNAAWLSLIWITNHQSAIRLVHTLHT